ncbi:unnamed protein product [Ostreobium quekettii]|uniref:protein-tyrosine-phosphatase n=1 Tax=Ostreobium quekettii TaxID=121088 RepID=A0A8S1J2P7_9CHLO|nr:unnamed protein product [Ostreobium quekettii]
MHGRGASKRPLDQGTRPHPSHQPKKRPRRPGHAGWSGNAARDSRDSDVSPGNIVLPDHAPAPRAPPSQRPSAARPRTLRPLYHDALTNTSVSGTVPARLPQSTPRSPPPAVGVGRVAAPGAVDMQLGPPPAAVGPSAGGSPQPRMALLQHPATMPVVRFCPAEGAPWTHPSAPHSPLGCPRPPQHNSMPVQKPCGPSTVLCTPARLGSGPPGSGALGSVVPGMGPVPCVVQQQGSPCANPQSGSPVNRPAGRLERISGIDVIRRFGYGSDGATATSSGSGQLGQFATGKGGQQHSQPLHSAPRRQRVSRWEQPATPAQPRDAGRPDGNLHSQGKAKMFNSRVPGGPPGAVNGRKAGTPRQPYGLDENGRSEAVKQHIPRTGARPAQSVPIHAMSTGSNAIPGGKSTGMPAAPLVLAGNRGVHPHVTGPQLQYKPGTVVQQTMLACNESVGIPGLQPESPDLEEVLLTSKDDEPEEYSELFGRQDSPSYIPGLDVAGERWQQDTISAQPMSSNAPQSNGAQIPGLESGNHCASAQHGVIEEAVVIPGLPGTTRHLDGSQWGQTENKKTQNDHSTKDARQWHVQIQGVDSDLGSNGASDTARMNEVSGGRGAGSLPPVVIIWDLDETLILYQSLLSGEFMMANPQLRHDALKSLGEFWKKAIYQVMDEHMFFRQIEHMDQMTATALMNHDDGAGLMDYNFGTDHLCGLFQEGSQQKLAYRYRLIRQFYSKGLEGAGVPLKLQMEWHKLYQETNRETQGWLDFGRKFLQAMVEHGAPMGTSQRRPVVNVVVSSGQLIPTLAKIMLFRLNAFFQIENIYSSWGSSKIDCFSLIKNKFGTNCSYCVVGDGHLEDEAAKAFGWPFIRVTIGKSPVDTTRLPDALGRAGTPFTSLTVEDVFLLTRL